MDNVQNNNALSRKQARQAAATASSIIQSSDENPEQVAEDRDLAVTYVRVTGNPPPPPQMMPGNREFFQRIIDAERNRLILSMSPRTASWLSENPSAAILAKDDIHNLSSFEEMAQRFGQVPKAFGDIKPPAKEPVASSTNPEAPPSTSPVSPATPQQAPASNAVRPDTPPNPPPEDAGSNPQPVSSPVDPAGSNAPPPDPLGESIQPTAQPAGPATENAAQPAASPPSSIAPIAENAPSAAESSLSEDDRKKEELIAEIRNARKLSPEQYEVLKEKVRTQPWFDAATATLYLGAVYEGRATADDINDINAQLQSRYSKVTTESGIQNFKELGKGTATGVVVGSGRIMEGTGQLLNTRPAEGKKALIDEIARAGTLTPDEIDKLRLKIDQQSILPRDLAQRAMSEVLAGDLTPEDVEQRFEPLLKEISENLQHGGEHVADYGKTMLPAAPGYENSYGRQIGETLGQALPATGTTFALGPSSIAGIIGGLIVESLRAAGDGTAAAREANLPEDKQTLAAMLYAPTALADLIPFGKAASSVLKFLPVGTVVQHLVKTIVKDGAAQATQLVAQNTIKHFLIYPKQEILEKVKDTFIAGGFAGVGKELLLDLGEKLLLRKRGSSHISASKPQAAVQDRQQFEELATTVESSKFRERDPEGHRQYTAEVLEDTKAKHAYAASESVEKYVKATGKDPFGLSGTHDMQVAKDTGSDLKLPMSGYLAHSSPSKADADFRDSMRFGADAFNYSEALASHMGAPAHRPVPMSKRSDSDPEPIPLGYVRVGDGAASPSAVLKKTGRVANSGNTKRNPDGLSITSPHQQP